MGPKASLLQGHCIMHVYCNCSSCLYHSFLTNESKFFDINQAFVLPKSVCNPYPTLFFNKQSIFNPRAKNCLSFFKKPSQKLFSNYVVDGLLTSIAYIFKHSEHGHSLLQGHPEYVMHNFELKSPKVSISLSELPIQKKGFNLFS